MKAIESDTNYNLTYAITSFGLTFTRLFIAFYVAITAIADHMNYFGISICILLIMVLDYYDGELFKKSLLNDVKQWRVTRRIFDGTVDRVVIQIVCLAVLFLDHSFVWVYTAILIREVLISSYVSDKFKKKVLLYPGSIAKISCVLIGTSVISFLLLSNSVLTLIVTFIMVITSILVFSDYRNLYLQFADKKPGSFSSRAEFVE